MIASFRDADTKQLWQTGRSRRIPANLKMRALKKLFLLHASVALDNLNVPPGNRLEALHGQRKGQHSIRINDQYRICFVWRDGNASMWKSSTTIREGRNGQNKEGLDGSSR